MKRVALASLVVLSLAMPVAYFATPASAQTVASRIVFAHKGKLLAIPPQGGKVRPLARIPANTVDVAAAADGRRFALLTNHSLPYPQRGSIRTIYILDLGHSLRRLAHFHTSGSIDIALSRNGRRVAYVREAEIWVAAANGTSQRQVTDDGELPFRPATAPAFTPSDKQIIFVRPFGGLRSAPDVLYRTALSGGKEIPLREDSGMPVEISEDGLPTVSRDGQIVYRDGSEGGPGGLQVISLNGGSPRTITLDRGKNKYKVDPTWSPDGRSIAFRRRFEKSGLMMNYRYSYYIVSGDRERLLIGNIRPFATPNGGFRAPIGPLWVPVP